jgi:hypothetical protein
VQVLMMCHLFAERVAVGKREKVATSITLRHRPAKHKMDESRSDRGSKESLPTHASRKQSVCQGRKSQSQNTSVVRTHGSVERETLGRKGFWMEGHRLENEIYHGDVQIRRRCES